MYYISFTKVFLKLFENDTGDEHFKKLIDENYGDFMISFNPFMMVFFYNMQSIALTFTTFKRMKENEVFFIDYEFHIEGDHDLDKAQIYIAYA